MVEVDGMLSEAAFRAEIRMRQNELKYWPPVPPPHNSKCLFPIGYTVNEKKKEISVFVFCSFKLFV
jgi:hypothetical protein